ncbi:MAG: hydrogenase maturation protease [Candidatus Sabulitectum sp.]|nr:hydrogenase maturation protease [Candidatus Sabulitectum sp.]
MTGTGKKVLVIGYGNPGRLDDGLGPMFAEEMEKLQMEGVTVDSNYQLAVEDVAAIAEHDYVVFVDADVSGQEPFHFEHVIPKHHMSFSSHSISADALMAMAADLLSSKAEAYMLGIRGYEFNEFGERISPGAMRNLDAALTFMKQALEDCDFAKYVNRFGEKNR